MAKLIAVTSCPTGIAHSLMAAEAIKRTAELMGHEMQVEIHGAEGTKNLLDPETIAAADAVLFAADIHVETEPFEGKPRLTVSTGRAIRDTQAVLEELLALVPGLAPGLAPAEPAQAAPSPAAEAGGRRIVAITACPTGIAHTFMAADALKKAAASAGDSISVETQGSVGAKNQLTDEDIAAADLVIIAADTHVDPSRFAGKRLYSTSVGAAVKGAADVIVKAKREATVAAGKASAGGGEKSTKGTLEGPYKHLLTGVSYMLPIVVAGGLLIALSFVFGIEAFKEEGTLAAALMEIGGGAAFKLMIPILSGYIAYSIADRPGLTPGLIGGMLAVNLEAGFLGGIISGFLAGYIALVIRDRVNLPQHFEGLKPVLVIPLLSTLAVGLLMIYVVGAPVKTIMDTMTAFLQGMGSTNAVILGLILGAMMAVDMGGPINKAAYTFAVGLLTSDTYMPMAAVMAAGMTPPLGIAIATLVGGSRFTQAEREAGKAAGVLGLSFITEGAIPFAAKDPLRVIPALILGSAVTGAMSMYFGVGLHAPHGGVFVLAIPNAVTNLGWYALAILTGTLITTIALLVLKPRLEENKVTRLAGAVVR
ncbi:PTS fructose-like transporter subunit IIB [Thiorhodococcus minor]|uniref:protein-N(pi)-phosphohistidine--D-fructose phosphotransferase n=1 Tax=Thiorhodococcus minor TaxID=57489 RepID=A0A6M0K1N2_9GAMM|nr:PTS fructose-like transporter subunit IIB [Thiorhodococcus minor]NEV63244.1 PTS fructose-like transporter subunit IIB [Thiorhodococcus minor]